MARQFYQDRRFTADSLALIGIMNQIVEQYVGKGYRLTVRQLYYQLVAKALIENTERSYKRVTGLVNDAKLAGHMDWDAIEDRTREFTERPHWTDKAQALHAIADQFHMDMWDNQPCRAFVIVEKEALAGVLERACRTVDVPLLAARGYPSGTVLREFVEEKMLPAIGADQSVRIFHFGDHDPSGIDMTRDLRDRIELFSACVDGGEFEIERVALNMDQIETFKPPPNPAKTTDARFDSYLRRYGNESWELDALRPETLASLVSDSVGAIIDTDQWNARVEQIKADRGVLKNLAKEQER